MRFLFIVLGMMLIGASARAQQLFPELDAKFQPPQKPTVAEPAVAEVQAPAAAADQNQDKYLRIQLGGLQGVLPYARTLSYCSGTATLTNETKQPLQSLSLTLTYGDMKSELSYGGVRPNGTQSRPVMLIGPPCESFLNMPEVEVKTCRWGAQSEDACKKKVKFIPPNS